MPNIQNQSSRNRAKEVIDAAIDEVNQLRPVKQRISKSPETILIGKSGALDSLGLINLLVAIEEKAEDLFDVELSLGLEASMEEQQSTFSNINNLTDYIAKVLEEI
ncbi:MAG: hypothetical protein P9L92_16975 [Candidatus Electryonea clarkiae]|nr:hypothetical protein [Candidatus Electryonea clarkiae]MDP8288219.1 hypothetical protein [Candidatus Electryonea clarkiae]